jgi:uncharacterized membrane protein
MREWLAFLSEQAIVVINAIALLVIVAGTVEVSILVARATLVTMSSHAMRAVWMGYARWLVAALTFQLAADIIETSISTSWDTIGRVGAIAVIRTFLNFFLDRDLTEVRVRRQLTRRHLTDNPFQR